MEKGTIGQALRGAAAALERAGVDAPRLTAEVLLAHALRRDRSGVLAHLLDPLEPAAQQIFAALVQRRTSGEPLQYLTGVREFFGLAFRVTPAVLIPRPETEILVEKAVACARNYGGAPRFADVGTGSGCIAVSFAHAVPRARGIASDISLEALAVARENARDFGVAGQIDFVCSDLFEGCAARPVFDLILCNPPYVAGRESASLQREVRDHEPHRALFGGATGLEVHRRVIPMAATRLAREGRLLIEIGAGQATHVTRFVAASGLAVVETLPDLQGIPRCLIAGHA